MCAMTQSYPTRLIRIGAMTCAYVCRDSFTRVVFVEYEYAYGVAPVSRIV